MNLIVEVWNRNDLDDGPCGKVMLARTPAITSSSSVSTIVVCVPVDRQELYTVLHEQGHVAANIVPERMYTFELRLDNEIRAWAWALKCIRPDWHEEFLEFAVRCLQTYRNLPGEMFRYLIIETEEEI